MIKLNRNPDLISRRYAMLPCGEKSRRKIAFSCTAI
jgi:hypothetical protein